ncbi:MAG: hypothetical protein ACT4NL_15495 [Pseudomarimonas sp.]
MNRPRFSTFAIAALFGVLASGCQRTLFEHAPEHPLTNSAADCDQALVGHWLSETDNEEEAGEIQVFVDPTCSVRTIERRKEGLRESAATQINTLILGRNKALAVSAAWANQSFDVNSNSFDHPGDVYLFGYRLRGKDRLQLLQVRHEKLARLGLERDLEADVLLEDGSLTVRVRGDGQSQHQQLSPLGMFDTSEPLNFIRSPEADQ